MVSQELNILNEGENFTIYKMIGPILAKQDLVEAKNNVKTRLEYITKECDRLEHLENEFKGTAEDKRMRCQSKPCFGVGSGWRRIPTHFRQPASNCPL